MGVNEFDSFDEGAESSSSGVNSFEVAEKADEQGKKSQAGQRRVRKDEKKSKMKDDVLYKYLLELLQDKSYDFIVDDLIKALYAGVPSFYILGAVSLVYLPISNQFREQSGDKLIEFNYMPDKEYNFSSSDLDPKIRNRLTDLVDDIVIISKHEPSTIMIDRFLDDVQSDHITGLLSSIVKVFLDSIKVKYSDTQLELFVRFILSELEKELKNLELSEV